MNNNNFQILLLRISWKDHILDLRSSTLNEGIIKLLVYTAFRSKIKCKKEK